MKGGKETETFLVADIVGETLIPFNVPSDRRKIFQAFKQFIDLKPTTLWLHHWIKLSLVQLEFTSH